MGENLAVCTEKGGFSGINRGGKEGQIQKNSSTIVAKLFCNAP